MRASDIVARFDQNRIAIATTQTKPDMAIMLADRLRAEVEKLDVFPSTDGQDTEQMNITVTIGVSCVEDRIKCGFDLTDVAEKAIKDANEKGRNRVYAYDSSDIEEPEQVIEAAAA